MDPPDWSRVAPAARAAYEAAVVEIFSDDPRFREERVWVVTAHNPGAIRLPDEENAVRNAALRAEIDARGIACCDAVGRDVANTWREASFALRGCGRDAALALARRWDQDAIFEIEPWSLPMVLPVGAGPEAAAAPTHSAPDAGLTRIPRIQTPRLLLREPRLADFEVFAADAADPLARAHIGGPQDRREAWRRLHISAGGWVLQGMGWWTVEALGGGPVGSVGVFRRETGPEVEIGWIIHRSSWGKGYATEAARAALRHAVEVWGIRRVTAYIPKENAASVAVATKIGMHAEGEAELYGEWDLLYAWG